MPQKVKDGELLCDEACWNLSSSLIHMWNHAQIL